MPVMRIWDSEVLVSNSEMPARHRVRAHRTLYIHLAVDQVRSFCFETGLSAQHQPNGLLRGKDRAADEQPVSVLESTSLIFQRPELLVKLLRSSALPVLQLPTYPIQPMVMIHADIPLGESHPQLEKILLQWAAREMILGLGLYSDPPMPEDWRDPFLVFQRRTARVAALDRSAPLHPKRLIEACNDPFLFVAYIRVLESHSAS
jgi:hypothetical protein